MGPWACTCRVCCVWCQAGSGPSQRPGLWEGVHREQGRSRVAPRAVTGRGRAPGSATVWISPDLQGSPGPGAQSTCSRSSFFQSSVLFTDMTTTTAFVSWGAYERKGAGMRRALSLLKKGHGTQEATQMRSLPEWVQNRDCGKTAWNPQFPTPVNL